MMKKQIFFIATLMLLFLGTINRSLAAAGDTTWVQAHNGTWLDWYNNFDTTIKFPDGTTKYRKIIMMFTLGKYVCPGTPTYCSDWDYTVQTYAMNKLGDTVELGRLITPYGKGPRMPASWTQTYYFDVSDFATVLKDDNLIRIHYSGYSGGFTANIKFALIEGTPERNVLAVNKLWRGSWAYGDAARPIDDKVLPISLVAPTGTESVACRVNITGHGSDPSYCSEFCKKYYQVYKGGTLVEQKDIWRDNCGSNQLYPQSGTWIYDRANWCPGATVQTNYHYIPSVAPGAPFDVSMKFEPYTSTGAASYIVVANAIFYGPINKALDVSLEDIIAPTSNDNYFRENARLGFTTVKIRNTGATPISSVGFEYGVVGEKVTTYTWSGTLAPLTDTVIDLPFAESLLRASGTNIPYQVVLTSANGVVDEDATNNKMGTTFNTPEVMPNSLFVQFLTNKATNGAGFSETSWKIINVATGAVLKERVNNAPSTAYRDTVLFETGVYKLVVEDEGCDGLSWWANTAAGSGSLLLKPTLFTTYVLPGYFGGDFGCGFVHYFKVGEPTSVQYFASAKPFDVALYPNPATEFVEVAIDAESSFSGLMIVSDYSGKTIERIPLHQTNNSRIMTKNLANGLYTLTVVSNDGSRPTVTKKFVVHHQ